MVGYNRKKSRNYVMMISMSITFTLLPKIFVLAFVAVQSSKHQHKNNLRTTVNPNSLPFMRSQNFLRSSYWCDSSMRMSLLYSSSTDDEIASSPKPSGEDSDIDLSKMRLSEMKTELKGMNISYDDCFDRESLTKRLLEARNGTVKPKITTTDANKATGASSDDDSKVEQAKASASSETGDESSTSSSPSPSSAAPSSTDFDRDSTLEQLRSLRVKELRTKCAERNIRWANMIEKEDLVQALLKYIEESSNFSPSGKLTPGTVADIDDETLDMEIQSGASTTPLLLDVYATWCGPCQLMAPHLAEAAKELGETVRVAKMDSDKHPKSASKLNIGGLPTIIVFDGNTGREMERMEGALMKNDLLNFVRKHL